MKAVNLTLNLYSMNTEPVQLVQGDYDATTLSAMFIDVDGSTLDLTGKTLSFKVLKADGTEFSTSSVTASGSTASVILSGQAVTAAGTNYGEFRISTDGGVKKVPRFEINVQESPELPDTQSKSELQELNEAIAKTENLPRIGENGNWEIYNGTAYEDTGNKSFKVGPEGPQGIQGAAGAAATISVGTVTTLPAGSQATATNAGTENAAVIDFGIPKGADGEGGGITQDLADARYVQQTRKVNGKALSSDITLAASDVGAVPVTLTINGHALSANLVLTKADIGLGNVDNTADGSKTVNRSCYAYYHDLGMELHDYYIGTFAPSGTASVGQGWEVIE
ncbi:MAG: DUF2479 domain-containing protein [Ruminococcaceae bacterium]|jgi:hypothetical protein|nr:DUF2479 domain-containing protein [Oscillospiraceae bacterium]